MPANNALATSPGRRFLARLQAGNWCDRSTCAISSSATSRPTTATRSFSLGRPKRTKAVWAKLQPYFQEEREEGRARRRREDALDPAGAQGRLYRPRQRGDRRPADRPAVQARDLPVRRPAHGRGRPEGRRASRPIRRCTRPSRNTASRTTTACSTPTRRRSCAAASPASSPACPTPMAAAASSATIAASRSTASTA